MQQWDGTPKRNGKKPVDLVISTFSMAADGKSQGCAVKGTTGLMQIDQLKKQRDQTAPGIFVVEPPVDRLVQCMTRFCNPNDSIDYIASDWSILRAYNPEVKVTSAYNSTEVFDAQEPENIQKESDRIGLHNDHPKVGESLNRALAKFLTRQGLNGNYWDAAWISTLQTRAIISSWHKPLATHHSSCKRLAQNGPTT